MYAVNMNVGAGSKVGYGAANKQLYIKYYNYRGYSIPIHTHKPEQ